jgi:CelD/BcsL family acetyltransferase involved in cellulose biosynthesis
LEELAPAWHALLQRSVCPEVMLSPTWLRTWWQVFGPLDGRQLRMGVFTQDERLIGLAPLLRRKHWHRRLFPFRRLEPLGSGEPEADAICSDYLNVIAERGAEAAVVTELAAALAAGRFGACDELVFPMMDGEGRMPALLTEALTRIGMTTRCTPTGAAPYIPLPASWDAYLKELTSSHRQYLKRALRAFERWAGGTMQVHYATTPAELDEGRRVLIALHRERWHDTPEGGVFRSPRFLAFHETVMPLLLEEGALELMWLSVRGTPVAGLYNLVWNGKVSFYQTGRSTQVPANVSPGLAILAQAIRGAIEAGRREFDFLGGVSLYKMRFALASRPIVEVRAAWPSLRERLRGLAEAGIAASRGWRRATRAAAARVRRRYAGEA